MAGRPGRDLVRNKRDGPARKPMQPAERIFPPAPVILGPVAANVKQILARREQEMSQLLSLHFSRSAVTISAITATLICTAGRANNLPLGNSR